MKYFRGFAIVVFLAGATLMSLAYAKRPVRPRPFVATSEIKVESEDAQNGKTALLVLAQTADGRWRQTKWSDAGKTVTVGDRNDVFTIKAQTLEYVGPNDPGEFSHDFVKNATSIENIAGLTAYVRRTNTDDGYIEAAYAAETGWLSMRYVAYFASAHYKQTAQVIAIQFRDVTDDEVAVPQLPVFFREAEAQIEAMKRSGSPSAEFEAALKEAKARRE